MLYRVICLGDRTTHGGILIEATDKITINGKSVVLVGHKAICPIHKICWVLPAGIRYTWMGREVCTETHLLSCGCRPIASQDLVKVGDDSEYRSGAAMSSPSFIASPAIASPIVGNASVGIAKRFANAATLGAAFPEHLTAAEEKNMASKVRNLYGGNDTIQNQADITAYNDKQSTLGVKHGQIFDTSEKAVAALGIVQGGIGLSKLGGAGKAAETIHPGLHNRAGLTPSVYPDSFKTRRIVDMNNLSPQEKAAKNALKLQGRNEELIEQIMSSGDNFEIQTLKPGDKLYGLQAKAFPSREALPTGLMRRAIKTCKINILKTAYGIRRG